MRRFIAPAAAVVAAMWTVPAAASEHITGIVLMAPAAGEIVMHHDPLGGMPAMTMTFRIPARKRFEPGDRISAEVDRSSDPWSLARIEVVSRESSVSAVPEPPILRVGDRVPDAPFIDQQNRPVSLRALHIPFAITFIYTRCADAKMCPLVSAKFRFLQQHLTAPAALIEVSLDPAYDRPPILARYGAAYGADAARWQLLTGEPKTVLDLAARFGILENAAGPVAIVHSERLAIVDRDGRIARFFDNAAWSPNTILDALKAQRLASSMASTNAVPAVAAAASTHELARQR
jgi:cytochrome oxidase Cu insertion factor (SCO1/SenC/PrrC family)/Cu/Ag efflux protein CusF